MNPKTRFGVAEGVRVWVGNVDEGQVGNAGVTNKEEDDSGGRLGSFHGQKIGEFLRSPCKEEIHGNPVDFDERRTGGHGGGSLKRSQGGVGKR